MKKNILFLSLLSSLLFFSACQKEYSLETSSTPSSGSLQADVSGDCLPKTVQGIYEAGTILDVATNYIDVQVNVTEVGSYRIYSDTVNGIFFQAKGAFATAGLNTVRLTGDGTPLSAGILNFIIIYDSTECNVAVPVLPQGSAGPAAFTLSGGPNTCLDYTLSGTYIKDVSLTAASTVAIKVNVTTIGTYSITTEVSNGIIFAGTGAFTALGPQTITLSATGTPAATGNTNIAVKAGSSFCGFTLDVAGPAAFTIDCASAVANGTYNEGVALDATNTVGIAVNVTTPGAYSITTTAVNGMTFSGSGNFTAVGSQTITLTGSGTPTADGTFDINIPGTTPACAFEVVVAPGATIDWKFTEAATVFQGAVTEASMEVVVLPPPLNTSLTTFLFTGETPSGDELFFSLIDLAGGIQANETYSSSSSTSNAAAFQYTGAQIYSADPSTTGVTLTFKVTSHVTGTKTIEGTFSGTVKDAANATKTITLGTFKGTYQ